MKTFNIWRNVTCLCSEPALCAAGAQFGSAELWFLSQAPALAGCRTDYVERVEFQHSGGEVLPHECRCPPHPQPQEPLSSLKSMAERAAHEGDMASLHLPPGGICTDTFTEKEKLLESIQDESLLILSSSDPLQTSSPAALQRPPAPRQHLSPPCQRSASPRHWGCAHWDQPPCPKTSFTNSPCRRRRGCICPTPPTRRESGSPNFYV